MLVEAVYVGVVNGYVCAKFDLLFGAGKEIRFIPWRSSGCDFLRDPRVCVCVLPVFSGPCFVIYDRNHKHTHTHTQYPLNTKITHRSARDDSWKNISVNLCYATHTHTHTLILQVLVGVATQIRRRISASSLREWKYIKSQNKEVWTPLYICNNAAKDLTAIRLPCLCGFWRQKVRTCGPE